VSDWKKDSNEQGEWVHTAGKWFADEADKGIQTSPDARFHNAWAAMDTAFSNEGKDLVLQFQVKHEQSLDCGGGYIKLIPASRLIKSLLDVAKSKQNRLLFQIL
jgi:calreticulin